MPTQDLHVTAAAEALSMSPVPVARVGGRQRLRSGMHACLAFVPGGAGGLKAAYSASRSKRFVLPLLFMLAASQPAYGQLKGDAELLRQVALEYRANRELITTWEGTVTVTSSFRGPAESGEWEDLTSEQTIDFAWDKAAGKYLFLRVHTKQTGTRSGKAFQNFGLQQEGGILLPDAYWTVAAWHPQGKDGTPKRPDLVIRPRRDWRPSELGGDFDPFHFMSVLDLDAHDQLMYFYAHAAEPFMSTWTVARDGSKVHTNCRKELEPGRVGTWQYVFDLAQGGNPIEVSGDDGIVTRSNSCTYERIGTIWLPRAACARNENRPNRKSFTVSYTWTANRVNETLNDRAFAPLRLGIRKGDKVRDLRTGAEYLYDEETDPLVPRRTPVWVYTAVGGAVLATLLVMLAGWRWRRRTAREAAHVT